MVAIMSQCYFYHSLLNVLWQYPQPPKANSAPCLNWKWTCPKGLVNNIQKRYCHRKYEMINTVFQLVFPKTHHSVVLFSLVILGTHKHSIKSISTCPKIALMVCQAFWQAQWASDFGIYFLAGFEFPSEIPFQPKTFPIRIFLSLLVLLSSSAHRNLHSHSNPCSTEKVKRLGGARDRDAVLGKNTTRLSMGLGIIVLWEKKMLFWSDSANTVCGVSAPQKNSGRVLWNHRMVRVGRGLKDQLIATPLLWAGTTSITPGYSEPHPAWFWAFPRMRCQQLLRANCASASHLYIFPLPETKNQSYKECMFPVSQKQSGSPTAGRDPILVSPKGYLNDSNSPSSRVEI